MPTWKPHPTLLPPEDQFRDGIRIGYVNDFRRERRDIHLPDRLINQSVLVPGRTRQGKSSLLAHIALGAMERGYGMHAVDTAGDLAVDLLKLIPPSRLDDVVYFNPNDRAYPVPINLFAFKRAASDVTHDFILTLERLADDASEHIKEPTRRLLRKALLLGFEIKRTQPWTLAHTVQFLENKSFRLRVLESLSSNPTNMHLGNLLEFWKNFENGRYQMELKAILNRLDLFIHDDILGPIFGKDESRLDFEEIVNNRRLFICNLGGIGVLRKRFLAKLLTNETEHAVMDRPPERRSPFLFLLDEFALYYNDAIEEIATQCAKYNASLVLAHQNLDQLPLSARSAILGNVGTIISFAVGPDYAQILVRRFLGIDASALTTLPPYHTLMSVEGRIAFRMRTYDNPAKGQ